ncbi:SAM-dependent methyltransferase [Bradyrhizobium liaoningense]
MSDTDKVFAGSIPRLYDEYLVPMIFAVYAEDIARRVAALSPSVLLEIAAGTGAVTRAVAAALPGGIRYVATDLNEPMLAVAAQRQAGDDRITWRQADGMALPFDDAEFDVVCCQFGAMFFPDRIKAYGEVKRVLKADGTFVFNVWDRIEDNVLTQEAMVALEKLFPDDPPRFMIRTPHGYCDKTVIRGDLERGLASVTYRSKPGLRSAARRRPNMSPPRSARAHRCAARSRQRMPASFRLRLISLPRRSGRAMAPARSRARSRLS